MKNLNVSDAWQKLLDEYNILDEVKKNGFYKISASQIKKVKEPRLMAKWDSSEQLPKSLKENKINILPDSRSSYVLSDFLLYQEIPQLTEHVKNMPKVELPELETIDVDNITSEANAINILQISGILEDFLELNSDDVLYGTFDGRMSSGKFDFKVNTVRKILREVKVDRAQVEIDGGFESDEYVVILEAKNVLHEDFHIRQLYYPFRLWENKVTKPIRLIFSIYTNKIFRLMEYRFTEKENYSSIELVQTKSYSLEDTSLSIEEIKKVNKSISDEEIISDEMNGKEKIPFIQADNFERIISLLENMYDNPMTGEEIEELMKFTSRQKDYYFNAGRYLGLFEKIKEDKITKYQLTKIGINIFRKNYKERQLELVRLILSHRIFKDLFEETIDSGKMPERSRVIELELQYNVCSSNVAPRRASSVISWINWIFNLINL
ncbi:TPA: type II restriction endonuclease [Streptococcus equi subsp. zooepidemicus]|uniref:type II restriction enzyme n=1 Tax=Streptococcus equi TaxID=1336 RepID=UPI001E49C6C3|nr:type II restriction endonuclease [Streptococcus equi]MCD3374816.1 type II restriction endonuclease [Streptococcus equi subsp. zooepidemicus]MDI5952557.1 type II restriction endonuclease [Streptococcus equi subsp. zooepidemicus]MDI6074510.1 type II restriction endonuclease [Streptococcus equi subsp. zooepidemicus]HEK9955804.1 type II restriction endonuclease [Streptococcus equi subsp. zooepidemicus]HEK9993453.1 type II restriction endonuclease [Streptococcus equi subsp. zooepidemicus]